MYLFILFFSELEDVSAYEILKFEAKEAVFLFDKKIVASFFLSPFSDPQIMSIVDLSDCGISHKKVLLMKEMLFALDSTGTKLCILILSYFKVFLIMKDFYAEKQCFVILYFVKSH